MEIPLKDIWQRKVTGGKQKIILDEAETAESDELDQEFKAAITANTQQGNPPETGMIPDQN